MQDATKRTMIDSLIEDAKTQPLIMVCALYKFVSLADFESLRKPIKAAMKKEKIFGTILLADEGINGTVAGLEQDMFSFLSWLKALPGLDNMDYKKSYAHQPPFKRAKVKLKKEIVTMGVEGINPEFSTGTYVEPEDWNALIMNPDVVLVDTRNNYEIMVGKFNNAVNPHTERFRQFPEYTDQHLIKQKHKKIAMYCTGGIRCEKSTAYLKQKGFEHVYHLKGGILNYLEKVPPEQSQWQGECFVFDDRVTVNHNLEQGEYDQCHACRFPISEQDKQSEKYQQGISCAYCFDQKTEEDKARFAEREKQIWLAEKRGEKHIGIKR